MDIKDIRKKLGMSRKEFAAELGVSPRTLEGYEQGIRSIERAGLAVRNNYEALCQLAGAIK